MSDTREELLRTLDLDGHEPGVESHLEVQTEGEDTGPPPSPYAFEVDRWAVRQGREMVKAHPQLAEDMQLTPEAVTDFHSAAFNPEPVLVDRCEDELRRSYLGELVETAEWKALVRDTAFNAMASELAALHFAQGYVELRGKIDPNAPQTPQQDLKDRLSMRRSIKNSLAGAQQDVDDQREVGEGFGLGDGQMSRIDPQRAAALYRKVRGNESIKQIMKNAGRFIRVAQGKQRTKITHGDDSLVGIEMGGELGRLVSGELASLVIPETELDTYRRLAERQALQRDMKTFDPIGKGPIVVVVDESGSMEGDPIETAKGLALAMGYIARRQKRWFACVSFSDSSEGPHLAFPPGQWDENLLLAWLEQFLNGGTTVKVPLVKVPFTYWKEFAEKGMPRGKTDMLLITDGEMEVPEKVIQDFNAWKQQEHCRVQTIIINSKPGELTRISDEVHRVKSLASDSEAVGHALSV